MKKQSNSLTLMSQKLIWLKIILMFTLSDVGLEEGEY